MLGAIAGAVLGGMYSDYRARKEADKNRNFQANMSNTSHTREVQDLRNAGLNPILSANAGASTASGSTAQTSDMTDVASTGLDALRLKNEVKALESQVALNEANTKAAYAGALKDSASAKGVSLTNAVLEAQTPSLKQHAEYDKNLAPVDAFLKRLGEGTSAVSNILPKIRIGTDNSKPTRKEQDFLNSTRKLPQLP